ncbi:GNAT family N-acetyltransferase [Flagellimonas sp. DF-77]|uniref:GNAT family N-acetyltransferase n=1 Tax=Flagellimonas algarum TaxID=3230298 RepID=UPI003398AD76
MEIRTIQPADNEQVATLIRSILETMGVPKIGTAYADAALDDMALTYSVPSSIFYVVEDQEEIVACAGIAPLAGHDGSLCELQKMYVAPKARRQGLASALLRKCMKQAVVLGFKGCYLETLPDMEPAQRMYRKMGFTYLDTPLGKTGHDACSVRMLKTF